MEEKLLNLLNEAHLAEESKDYDKAIELYEEALRLSVQNDDKAMLFEFIGQCYEKQGREHLAFENFSKAFVSNPEYENGWYLFYRYAQLAYKFRKFDLSIEYLDKAVYKIPSDYQNYIQYSRRLLGNNFLEIEQYKRALSEFKDALKIDTNSHWKSHIYLGIAHAYFGLNKITKSIKFALKTLKEEYDEAVEERIYFLLAICYSKRGIHCDTKKELYYTEKLQKEFPDSAYLRELKMVNFT